MIYEHVRYLADSEADTYVDALLNVDGVVVHGATTESADAVTERLYSDGMLARDPDVIGERVEDIPAHHGESQVTVWHDTGVYVLVAHSGLRYLSVYLLIDGEAFVTVVDGAEVYVGYDRDDAIRAWDATTYRTGGDGGIRVRRWENDVMMRDGELLTVNGPFVYVNPFI